MRLALGNFRCAVCGSKKKLQIHHLTYDRIFKEEMTDLIPLCDSDHERAEDFKRRCLIPKEGSPLFLMTETVRILSAGLQVNGSNGHTERNSPNRKSSKVIQGDLMQHGWFLELLGHDRYSFKSKLKKYLKGNPMKVRIMSNAFVLFGKHHYKYAAQEKTGIVSPDPF